MRPIVHSFFKFKYTIIGRFILLTHFNILIDFELLVLKNSIFVFFDEIIKTDEERRQSQTSLDNLSAIANSSAKQIGELMRNGKKDEAEALKAETTANKEQIKNKTLIIPVIGQFISTGT